MCEGQCAEFKLYRDFLVSYFCIQSFKCFCDCEKSMATIGAAIDFYIICFACKLLPVEDYFSALTGFHYIEAFLEFGYGEVVGDDGR